MSAPAPENENVAHLRSILTPEVLERVHELAVPRAGITAHDLFGGRSLRGDASAELRRALFSSVFVPLSRVPYASFPEDMLRLLAPLSPDDAGFPVRATGLVVLLDQATRMALRGIEARWTNGFFDPLACRLARQLCDLPPHLRVDDPQRWVRLGGSFTWEDGMLRAQLLHVPFVHTDDPESYERGMRLAEERRLAVEAHYGKTDPARTDDRAAAVEKELGALPQLVRGPSPPAYYAQGGFPEYFWFRCQINRAHSPPLREFGRYPWRNGALGRESTQGESDFLDSIGHFGELDPDVAEAIRVDVRKGCWTPL